MTSRSVREEKVEATREAILTAAERLFAEHGVYNVSNRQISDAAGQGNTAAVNYHFGGKTDLVRAISRRHTEQIELIRARLVAESRGSTVLRDWVACMVRPVTEHLDGLGSPTWYARFNAQVTADPALYETIAAEPAAAPALQTLLDGLNACLPDLPPTVQAARGVMARHLIVQMCVERERGLAGGESYPPSVWTDTAELLIDALTGLWNAPATG
ncbi:TetR/AcrR family transcriptional regulator [Streptomyces sp. AJS327]|uniref:TetR/AcrR family transcriptional regulator n=1 Tax=Streptomyces sp. AJS327 TaxID=2545265 RepID=UPI0015DFCE3F|nr:TetR/AcrR family transcriptional regulator [Streptomyces sp. AJS327]MBA0050643.1 TetR/AcrR family transcriptional regulator [Streptomyces sp. AJS327]